MYSLAYEAVSVHIYNSKSSTLLFLPRGKSIPGNHIKVADHFMKTIEERVTMTYIRFN